MSLPEKRCANCGKFSPWQEQYDDVCTHCGQTLDPRIVHEHEVEEEREIEMKDKSVVFIVTIKDGDSWPVRMFKRAVQGVQIVFMAIVSFIIWLTVAVAG